MSSDKAPKNKISYQWGKEHMVITIGNQTPLRIKMLFWTEFLFTCSMITVLLCFSLPANNTLQDILFISCSAIVYILAGYRFLSRLFYRETLLLDSEGFTIVQRNLFHQKSSNYQWKQLGTLHYCGTPSKTDHPLKGKCFDYFGFETQEHLIQNLHADGNLFFNHKGIPVKFAKGVYSWDAEEMVNMMKLYAGSNICLGPEWAEMQQHAHEWDDNHH